MEDLHHTETCSPPPGDPALPLGPGLLAFLASASDGIRTAMHRPQVRRRRINVKKYFQRQLYACRTVSPYRRTLSRPPSQPDSATHPTTVTTSQRVTEGHLAEQRSLEALFDPLTVSAASDDRFRNAASFRRRKLPASFFNEPKVSCESPRNPIDSPGSAASNDSNYADSQGSDPAGLVTAQLDLDALLASPLWSDEEESFSDKMSPGVENVNAASDGFCDYRGQQVNPNVQYFSSTHFGSYDTDIISHSVSDSAHYIGQQIDQSENGNEQLLPSCQFNKRYHTARQNAQMSTGADKGYSILTPANSPVHYQQFVQGSDDNRAQCYTSQHEFEDVMASEFQTNIRVDKQLRLEKQISRIDQRCLPEASIQTLVNSSCGNYTVAKACVYSSVNGTNNEVFPNVYSAVTNGTAFPIISSVVANTAVFPLSSPANNSVFPSVSSASVKNSVIPVTSSETVNNVTFQEVSSSIKNNAVFTFASSLVANNVSSPEESSTPSNSAAFPKMSSVAATSVSNSFYPVNETVVKRYGLKDNRTNAEDTMYSSSADMVLTSLGSQELSSPWHGYLSTSGLYSSNNNACDPSQCALNSSLSEYLRHSS